MKIVVSDTSVLIDIERGEMVATIFRLPFQFVVPDALYDRELKDYQGPVWLKHGLIVEELSGAEVSTAQMAYVEARALSAPDRLAFALSFHRRWTLLAGDKLLRRFAKSRQVDVHGVLWLFDELERRGLASNEELDTGLTKIKQHPNCRLPANLVQERLARYKSGI